MEPFKTKLSVLPHDNQKYPLAKSSPIVTQRPIGRRVRNGNAWLHDVKSCLTPEVKPFVKRFPFLPRDKQPPELHVQGVPLLPSAPSNMDGRPPVMCPLRKIEPGVPVSIPASG